MRKDAPRTLLNGKYELIELIGRGGMAAVWKAMARGAAGFERTVAVKRMLIDIASDPQTVELFVEEARVGAQLTHPNIVQVLDFGADEGGAYFLVMDWVDGMDLLDYMRSYHQTKRHVPWQAVAAVAVQALEGLAGAHEHIDATGARRPVIHRDVTPSNILISKSGVVKLADFGLSRAMDRMTHTLPNVIKGKLSYIAPELTRGKKASVSTDIFALGVSLWESLAGRRLFGGNAPLEVIKAIQAWNIPSLTQIRPEAPPQLVAMVERAIAKRPEDRFTSTRDMLRVLQGVLRALPDPVDAGRLGISVTHARERIRVLDQDIAKDLEIAEEALPSEVSVELDFNSSPAAGRSQPEISVDEAPTLPMMRKAAPVGRTLPPLGKMSITSSLASGTKAPPPKVRLSAAKQPLH